MSGNAVSVFRTQPVAAPAAHGRAICTRTKEEYRMSIRFAAADVATATVLAPPRPAPKPDAVPGVRDVRTNMGDEARQRSTAKGLLVFAISVIPYALALAGFLMLDGWLLKALSAALFTVSLPMLFIVGHDACHQSLTPHRWLNKLIGRLTMAPTWHAYS